MIEEHVIKLAELQAELDNENIKADFASANIDARMTCLKEKLAMLEKERDINRRPYTEAAEELKTTIRDLYTQIIDEWTGEHDILDRMSVEDIIKKYIGVHELPIDVAEIEYKTTVKLEQKSG